MRTTLTLDDDVAIQLERLRESRKLTLKQAVNEVLREGLRQVSAPQVPAEPYRINAVSLGKCLIGNLDNIAEALAIAEGDAHR